jgi:hypothetical protein
MSGLDVVYARSDRMVGRRIAGEYVLVPLGGKGVDLDAILNLNSVGAFIWEQLDGRRSGVEIVAAMLDRFEVERLEAERDYLGFLDSLREAGAVAAVRP